MREAYVVDAVRTPIGRYGGALKDVRPDDLAAVAIRRLVERTGVPAGQIEDVVFGAANQAGEDNRNVGRMAALLAGLPVDVPGQTINRLCGSGLQAVVAAAQAIRCGEGDLVVAGGVESMTRAPFVLPKPDTAFPRGDQRLFDTTIGWRLTNPRLAEMYPPLSMGETAENVAERFGVSRPDQDRFALESHRKAVAATAEGRFKAEIVPVPVPGRRGEVSEAAVDEQPRPDTSLEKLAALKPAFREGGTVTAGNSSGINDGAAAILLASADAVRRGRLRPLARIGASAVAGVHPSYMGMGPIPASQKALARAGLGIGDLDVVELNEAFAAQAIACVRQLGLPDEIVNPNGGAIALGHPLGCSGARILTTLVHELARRRGRYGLATMCIGVGQGIAVVVERVD
ncbi:MAG: 3-oxoadipyl-CoA thiolase [Chloroflexi bacterium]|nr:3-oxoadipyl-CoA thiolase [Chloroflexota bacterium]